MIEEINKLSLDTETRQDINWLPGDRALLYLPPLHEGMHPDDQYDDRVPPLVEILEVHRHPNNPGWVQDFTVMILEGEYEGHNVNTVKVMASALSHYVYPEG